AGLPCGSDEVCVLGQSRQLDSATACRQYDSTNGCNEGKRRRRGYPFSQIKGCGGIYDCPAWRYGPSWWSSRIGYSGGWRHLLVHAESEGGRQGQLGLLTVGRNAYRKTSRAWRCPEARGRRWDC